MNPEPLEFARGVRLARPDELPEPSDEALARIAAARITNGYTRKDVADQPFSAFIEANVHPSRVWTVFAHLVRALLPQVAAPIIGMKDDDPVFGPYTTRDLALQLLERYRESLQHDGFLEFGAIFSHEGRTEEVFVKSVKSLQIWTNHPDRAVAVLEEHGIPPVPDLQFIDDYPRVSQALPLGGRAPGGYAVVEEIEAAFKELPALDAPPER